MDRLKSAMLAMQEAENLREQVRVLKERAEKLELDVAVGREREEYYRMESELKTKELKRWVEWIQGNPLNTHTLETKRQRTDGGEPAAQIKKTVGGVETVVAQKPAEQLEELQEHRDIEEIMLGLKSAER